MHPDTPLRVSHDAGLALQIKLERVPEVERCFVHVDYTRRAEPEHALDRALSGLPPTDPALELAAPPTLAHTMTRRVAWVAWALLGAHPPHL